jgi:hypothetical protein
MRTEKFILISLLFIAASSCKKNGTGGSTEIAAFPAHHGRPIKGCTLYVKFKAKDLPSNPESNYDLKAEGEADEDHVHIHDLLPGDYYLYATGFDSTIHQAVKGGIPLVIKRSDKHKELDVNIAVSE